MPNIIMVGLANNQAIRMVNVMANLMATVRYFMSNSEMTVNCVVRNFPLKVADENNSGTHTQSQALK